MFVDTFTVQYLQNLRKSKENAEEKPSRIAPIVSIFAGIILLICSIALLAAKSGDLPNKLPHVKMPNVKMPNVKLPQVELPKLPKFPKISFRAEQAYNGPPRNPIIAGYYEAQKLYNVKGVSCHAGSHYTIWQDAGSDGTTVFGSDRGGVVGSITMAEVWKKGEAYFTLATYKGNQRGILQVAPRTQIVQKINPGDGCVFDLKCLHVGGRWEKDMNVQCSGTERHHLIKQTGCRLHVNHGEGFMKDDVLYGGDNVLLGRVRSNNGVLEFRDTEGCVFKKVNAAAAGEA